MRKSRLRVTTGVVAVVSACVPSHSMQQRPYDGSCPARFMASPSASQADAEAGNALTWSGPAESGDIEQNNVWCRTVGRPVFRALPLLRLEEANSVDSVAVLTWNINLGGGDVVAFLAEELRLTCDPDEPAIRELPFHFVILLQEVFRVSATLPQVPPGPTIPWRIDAEPPPGGLRDIVEVAERCGLALLYVPSARNGPSEPGRQPEDKGAAILSTLPLTDFAAIELPFEAIRKVAVVATIRGPAGERIRVASVHLTLSATLARTLTSGNATRLRQAMGLVEALESTESSITIVGGDFNTWSASEATLKRLALHFPDSPAWTDALPVALSPPITFCSERWREVGSSSWRVPTGGSKRRTAPTMSLESCGFAAGIQGRWTGASSGPERTFLATRTTRRPIEFSTPARTIRRLINMKSAMTPQAPFHASA